ncbi:hypothetical protein [Arthrobacter sp. UM1]|uniref:hypothetical protein n=1 Tax=Arthrobacter sp. UM1 TaxID=2766776 RepID=UPI001CF64156|nr:hypothetical protein [Arthrobacter sp. UM1]MCB4208540.1 hypothetical protein [Arthrobacter sp. UM1]
MKFDMGAQTLGTLARDTGTSSDELVSLVRQLVDAAQPLEGKFSGGGKAKFDEFKSRVDEVTNDLSTSLAAINQGQSEMNQHTQTGDQDTADNAQRAQGTANFDGARFAAR